MSSVASGSAPCAAPFQGPLDGLPTDVLKCIVGAIAARFGSLRETPVVARPSGGKAESITDCCADGIAEELIDLCIAGVVPEQELTQEGAA